MQPGTGDARRNILHIADAMEQTLGQTDAAMVRTEKLIELVEGIANDLFQLAEDWEPVDPQRAERWRAQERQIRALSEQFAHLEEMEAAEAKSIISALRELAHRAQGT
jgi:hypothetical protein